MIRLFRFKRVKDETGVEYHTSCCKAARKIWIQMALPFLYGMIAESMWRGVGWVCDQRPNAVIDSLKQVSRWRGSRWWHTIQTEGMRDDPQSRTRWRHKWKWHTRGHVWDKIATDWAGEDDWISKRKNKKSMVDKTEFVTFVLDSMKLSTARSKMKGKGKGKTSRLKTAKRTGAPEYYRSHTRRGPCCATVWRQ